ncbi:MAG: 3-hydroxyacyl-CoA dehydrogenase [Cellulomonas sp. 73-92]|uniref:3-hydroxyacyl-CoA dehydrogenase NAD-binding domain-containing protein n=1 Tax=Cellulomonas sp. 73-92 TaxID=1895740 RepID=UPI000926E8AE|nr:3-hydroxyacyl-CoA dehydrogenase NAD-binding domain-containing protein [Cellulomonas sp. 73-92]OJV80359.1 MAG: 3-hydroxyacyl-CoA dehydrogenase [Cellulomonas sp. 73-92]
MSQTASHRPERVARASLRDVALPGGGTLVLVTVDNGLDAPTTLGPQGLAEVASAFATVRQRAHGGHVAAVAVTGRPGMFVAGADLGYVASVHARADALELARAGHAAYGMLADLGVPTFAFLGGAALGGGLELALACRYRTVAADVTALGLPETSLGLVPGWGGVYRLPRLVGIEAAIDVVLARPAAHRNLAAAEAARIGLVDAVLPPEGFVEASIAWAGSVLAGEVSVARRPLDDDATWSGAVARARRRLEATIHASRPAPYRALDLLDALRPAATGPAVAVAGAPTVEDLVEPVTAAAAEDEALADLATTDEMRSAAYAFGLVTGAKRPAGAPDAALARPVGRVGVVGAGLMATQIAQLVARRLRVPVVLRDVDDERVTAGLAALRASVQRQVEGGRLAAAEGDRIVASVSGSTDVGVFSGCDLVIEAVTEVLDVKRQVFAELEGVVGPGTVLATNTSALSVTEMADGLAHPERVVGLHFFNPVAAMPLVEVVRAERTDDAALATAFDVVARLGKNAVGVRDRPGFVVNRLLVLLLGVVLGAVEEGTPVEVADRALDPLGLPMPPFELLDLVGPAVGLHVLTSLRADLGDRFPASPGLARLVADRTPLVLPAAEPGLPRRADPAIQAAFGAAGRAHDEAGVRDAVLAALATEIGLMLDEGVVPEPQQIDRCMILGAGWPWHLGGISPYLDRSRWSERVLGHRLLPDGTANVPKP